MNRDADKNPGPVTGQRDDPEPAAQLQHLFADAVEAILAAWREGRAASAQFETVAIILDGNFYHLLAHGQSNPDLGRLGRTAQRIRRLPRARGR